MFTTLCLFLFRIAKIFIPRLFQILCHGTHPIFGSTTSITSDFTINCIEWSYVGINFICLQFFHVLQHMVIECIFNQIMNYEILNEIVTQVKLATHRKINRLRKRHHMQNKIFLVSYFGFYHMCSYIQIKYECRW